jgi:hypothetical protein
MEITVRARGRFHESIERLRRQASAADAHYGFPSAVMCAEVKEHAAMPIWDNQRISTDERQYEMEKSCARMA